MKSKERKLICDSRNSWTKQRDNNNDLYLLRILTEIFSESLSEIMTGKGKDDKE